MTKGIFFLMQEKNWVVYILENFELIKLCKTENLFWKLYLSLKRIYASLFVKYDGSTFS